MPISRTLAALLLWLSVIAAAASETEGASLDPTPNLALGARTYSERCALCHGNRGMGEGIMPLLIKGYPSTNLLDASQSNSLDALRDAIIWGGEKSSHNEYSPPWGAELTWTQIESLVLYVDQLRNQPLQAAELRNQIERSSTQPSLLLGSRVFRARCALCHGGEGKGDGRLARLIKNPPPFNLTLSRVPPDYLRKIVSLGGAGVGRSGQMPPWGDTLSPQELDSVLSFLLTLRH